MADHVSTIKILLENAAGRAAEMGKTAGDSASNQVERHIKNISAQMKPRNIVKLVGQGVLRGARATKRSFLSGFSIGTLIRQSQIFTASMGAIFQVIGAMIDTILAPMAPHIAKGISFFATHGIRAAKSIASLMDGSTWKGFFESLSKSLPKIIESFVKIALPTVNLVISLVKFIKDILGAGGFWGAVEVFIGKLWDGFLSIKDTIKAWIGDMFASLLPEWVKKGIDKLFKTNLSGAKTWVEAAGLGDQNIIKHIEKVGVLPDVGYGSEKSSRSGQPMPHGFIKNPKNVEEIKQNIITGSNLVKDIYSGFGMDGETPGLGRVGLQPISVFNEKGAPGLKDAVNKIVKGINNPSTFAPELREIINESEQHTIRNNIQEKIVDDTKADKDVNSLWNMWGGWPN